MTSSIAKFRFFLHLVLTDEYMKHPRLFYFLFFNVKSCNVRTLKEPQHLLTI